MFSTLFFAAVLAATCVRAVADECVRYDTFAHRVGGLQFGGASDVVASGDFAYVTGSPFSQPGQLRIVDVSDPAAPRMRGSVGVTGAAQDVAVSGVSALVITLESGLHVLDVSNPDAPALAGWVDTPGTAVAASGSLAYVCSHGLQVIDISDPRAPHRIGSASTSARYIAVANGLAYVSSWSGLEIYDVADPAVPVRIGQLALPQAGHLDVGPGYVYMVDGVWLRVVDVSDPTAPRLSGAIRLSYDTVLGNVVARQSVVLASAEGRVKIVDVASPDQPQLLGSLPGQGAAFAADLAYAAAGIYGLQIFDISNPAQVSPRSTLPTPRTSAVTISGAHLFGVDADGLYVVDLAGPDPYLLGSIALPGVLSDIAVDGGIAYVAAGPSGLHVVDVSDPSAPVYVGTWDTIKRVNHVEATDGRVLAISGPWPDVGDAVTILDASQPESLQTIVGWYEVGAFSEYVLAGDLLYGIGWSLGIFDVTAPYGLLGWVSTPGGSDLVLDGTHAYVASTQASMLVIDVADPHAPRLEASIPMPTGATSVTLTGGTAYVMDAIGLQVIDITQPTAPRVVGDCPTVGMLATDGQRLYAAGDNLQALPLQCPVPVDTDLIGPPHAPRLLQPYPNPFNPAVTIPFELDVPGSLRLAVYDTAGRLVREILHGAHPAGMGITRWDGRDASGTRVASGLYVVRLEAGSAAASRKIMLIE